MQLVRHHAALLQAAGFVDEPAEHGLGFTAIAEGADILAFAGPEIPQPGLAEQPVRAFMALRADISQAGAGAGAGAGILHGRLLGYVYFYC